MSRPWKDEAIRRAAQEMLADATHLNVEQVNEVILREADRNDEDPLMVTLAPLGTVLGVRIWRRSDPPKDEDTGMAFVSMRAFINALPALGVVIGPGAGLTTRALYVADRPNPEPAR